MYSNSDIIFQEDLWQAVQLVEREFKDFVVVGKRRDVRTVPTPEAPLWLR